MLIFILFLFVKIAFAQSLQSDSIDYSSILSKKTYRLVKVKSKKMKEVVYDDIVVLYFKRVEKREHIEPAWATTINIGDTLMWADWDFDKGTEPIRTHSCGKITLNQKTNVLTLEKYIWGQKKTTIRKFRVLKFQEDNIKFLDLSNIELRRVYSFE